MKWLWRFFGFSFAGFLLEVCFARAIGHPKRDRKCFLLLPLCPVYGLGAMLILALVEALRPGPLGVMGIGFVTATATEYGMGLFYERVLGVRFWDYRGLPGNLGGKVCLPFSLVWAGLSLILVYWFAPEIDVLAARIPDSWGAPAIILLLCDSLVSVWALYRTGDTDVLRWYQRRV